MPRKCKNDYEPMNDKEMLLTITKLNGTKKPAVFDTWNLKKVEQRQWHVTANGYTKTGRDIGITDIIMGPPPDGFVWHHQNFLRGDNRESNLSLVTDSVNKVLRIRKGKKSLLPNGLFPTESEKIRVRSVYKNHQPTMPNERRAIEFRFHTLKKKGVKYDDARYLLGQLSRKEYDDYWKIRTILGN
ncbi:MAG: hypothetical protein RBR67_17830 [Desulfobacterium sp.]|nr:hypothetical protein [Desulfobacterium sp.]